MSDEYYNIEITPFNDDNAKLYLEKKFDNAVYKGKLHTSDISKIQELVGNLPRDLVYITNKLNASSEEYCDRFCSILSDESDQDSRSSKIEELIADILKELANTMLQELDNGDKKEKIIFDKLTTHQTFSDQEEKQYQQYMWLRDDKYIENYLKNKFADECAQVIKFLEKHNLYNIEESILRYDPIQIKNIKMVINILNQISVIGTERQKINDWFTKAKNIFDANITQEDEANKELNPYLLNYLNKNFHNSQQIIPFLEKHNLYDLEENILRSTPTRIKNIKTVANANALKNINISQDSDWSAIDIWLIKYDLFFNSTNITADLGNKIDDQIKSAKNNNKKLLPELYYVKMLHSIRYQNDLSDEEIKNINNLIPKNANKNKEQNKQPITAKLAYTLSEYFLNQYIKNYNTKKPGDSKEYLIKAGKYCNSLKKIVYTGKASNLTKILAKVKNFFSSDKATKQDATIILPDYADALYMLHNLISYLNPEYKQDEIVKKYTTPHSNNIDTEHYLIKLPVLDLIKNENSSSEDKRKIVKFFLIEFDKYLEGTKPFINKKQSLMEGLFDYITDTKYHNKFIEKFFREYFSEEMWNNNESYKKFFNDISNIKENQKEIGKSFMKYLSYYLFNFYLTDISIAARNARFVQWKNLWKELEIVDLKDVSNVTDLNRKFGDFTFSPDAIRDIVNYSIEMQNARNVDSRYNNDSSNSILIPDDVGDVTTIDSLGQA